MKTAEIANIIDPEHQYLYAPTYAPITLMFKDGSIKVGYFQETNDSNELKEKDIFTFVEFGVNAQRYRATGDTKYITKIEGDKLLRVKYPHQIIASFDQVFKIDSIHRTISPLVPVRIGGITIGSGISFDGRVTISGLNLMDYTGQNIEGYIDKGILVIQKFSNREI